MAQRIEVPEVKVSERSVLKKFDGDLTPEQMEVANPVEILVIQDGEIVDHWRRGDQRDSKQVR